MSIRIKENAIKNYLKRKLSSLPYYTNNKYYLTQSACSFLFIVLQKNLP